MSVFLRVRVLALALALSLGVAAAAPVLIAAQEATEAFSAGDRIVANNGTLNLRASASVEADVVQVLAEGTVMTVTADPTNADGLNWYPVRTDSGAAGFVSAMYVEAAPVIPPAIGDTIIVRFGPLNLRDTPTEEGSVTGQLEIDVTATVLNGPVEGGSRSWYLIETDDDTQGYVAAEFIAIAPPETFAAGESVVVDQGPVNLRAEASVDSDVIEVLEDAVTVTVVSGPVVGGEHSWYEVRAASGETGFTAAEFLTEIEAESASEGGEGPDFPIGSFVFAAEDIEIREAGMIDATVVSTLADGATATVTEGPVAADDFTWFQVTVGSGDDAVTGWAQGESLTGGIVLGTDAQVADGPLNLREDASASSVALAALETGDIVNVISGPEVVDGVAWFEVAAGDDTGFVAGRYLGAADEAESASLEP